MIFVVKAFKRGEQEKQNAMYHNRLLAEESMRESQQAQVKRDLFLVNAINGDPK